MPRKSYIDHNGNEQIRDLIVGPCILNETTVIDREPLKLPGKFKLMQDEILFLVVGTCLGLLIGLVMVWRVSYVVRHQVQNLSKFENLTIKSIDGK